MLLKQNSVWFLLGLLLLTGSPLMARFARMDEASYQKSTDVKIRVFKNWTFTTEEVQCRELLDSSEKARGMGSISISFSPVTQKVLNFEAWVEFGKKKTPVTKDNIEIKDTSGGQGFDDYKVYHIAFADVKKGANLCFKMKIINQPIVAKSFSFNDGFTDPYKSYHLRVESEVPLFFEKIGNPEHFHASESIQNKNSIYEVKLKKPFNFDIVEEPEGDGPSPGIPRFILTSSKSHDEFYKSLLPAYQERLKEKLPETFEKIILDAQKEPDFSKKIELVMAEVNDVVRYHGDWRTTENKFVPRPFEKVIKTKYGDCKDFAALTTAILQRLNIKASVAFVFRGPFFPFDYQMPFLSEFNHAIVHITTDTNQDLWVDPTNTIMYARAPREDISGRKSLILDQASGTLALKVIPLSDPKDAKRESQIFYDISSEKNLSANYHLTYDGLWGVWLATLFYQKPTSQMEFAFLNSVTQGKKPIYSKLEKISKIESRLPQSISASMKVTIPYRYYETPLGKGIILDSLDDIATLTHVNVEGYESGIMLQNPTQIRVDMHYLGVSALGDLTSLSCTGTSRWLDYERWIEQNAQGVTISNNYKIKLPFLTRSDILSPEFTEFQGKLSDCFENKMMIIKPIL